MFIGRKEEMKKLDRLSKLNKASLVVCEGRRRIGKSRLIQEFGKKYNHFIEVQGLSPRQDITNKNQLSNFSRVISTYFGLPLMTFNNWNEALMLLAKLTEKIKVLIFLDEISWMGSDDKDFVGQLKIAWDTKFKKNTKLMLVLCGSVSSWIDHNILNSTSFMGRVSLTIKLDELSLSFCNQFWGKKKERISSFEKFKLLAITGGIPRYLEEIHYSETAESNIKAMCFDRSGLLFNEFDSIFNDIFSKKATIYKQIVSELVTGNHRFIDICKKIKVAPNGVISKYLDDLEKSGFISRDYVYSLKTGNKGKLSKYRLKDNYMRFYLKYIEPNKDKIKKGLYQFSSMENLSNFDIIMGFQLENLVHNNIISLISMLNIPYENILSASPYFQNRTSRQKACQIDLLIHTKNSIYICEIKFRKKTTNKVIGEVKEKIKRLKYPKNYSIRPVLIYLGTISKEIESEQFFDKIIPLERYLD